MKQTRNLLIICALGYATSTMMKKVISDFFSEQGIENWNIDSIGYNMSESYVKKADLIVSSLELNENEYEVPILNGVSLISGINKEETLNQILDIINIINNIEYF